MSNQPLKCPRCGNLNLPTSNNCTNCGNVLQLVRTSLSSKNLIALLLVLAIPVLCCGICSLGKTDRPSPVVSTTSTPTPPSSTATSLYNKSAVPSNSPVPNAAAETDSAPKTLVRRSADSRTATVISESANLRETPDSNGTVIQELPEGSELRIVKQKSAWFFVKYGSQSGWVHGNTIKPADSKDGSSKSLPDTTGAAPLSRSTPAPRAAPRIEKANPSGATARCGDGSLSFSASRRGTCSHHGGVAEWY